MFLSVSCPFCQAPQRAHVDKLYRAAGDGGFAGADSCAATATARAVQRHLAANLAMPSRQPGPRRALAAAGRRRVIPLTAGRRQGRLKQTIPGEMSRGGRDGTAHLRLSPEHGVNRHFSPPSFSPRRWQRARRSARSSRDADLALGEKLIVEHRCSAATCRPRVGGDGSASSTAGPHQQPGALRGMVEYCGAELNLSLFPEETAAIAAVLDRDHYRFGRKPDGLRP